MQYIFIEIYRRKKVFKIHNIYIFVILINITFGESELYKSNIHRLEVGLKYLIKKFSDVTSPKTEEKCSPLIKK